MSKSVIAPIIGFIFVVIHLVFGVEVGEDLIAQVVDWVGIGVALGATLYGIIKNHKKDPH